jgi:hypothetical protein
VLLLLDAAAAAAMYARENKVGLELGAEASDWLESWNGGRDQSFLGRVNGSRDAALMVPREEQSNGATGELCSVALGILADKGITML